MKKLQSILYFVVMFVLGSISVNRTMAQEVEGLSDRDLTVKESFDRSPDPGKSEVGEIEKESEHDFLSSKDVQDTTRSERESVNSGIPDTEQNNASMTTTPAHATSDR